MTISEARSWGTAYIELVAVEHEPVLKFIVFSKYFLALVTATFFFRKAFCDVDNENKYLAFSSTYLLDVIAYEEF